MATIPAARSRHRHERSFGQIPLSSSEIELYSRQDEVARRRRRLVAVRDEERRLAQQMTRRYRTNLHKLQHKKLHMFQKELSIEQQKVLNELQAHDQKSLQSTEIEERNARLKLREFMNQVQKETNKWPFGCQLGGKQPTVEAHGAHEKQAVVTAARRRQGEPRKERLEVAKDQQTRRTSAGFRQAKDVARVRVSDKEELEMLRRMQSSKEVVVTSRPRQRDRMSYRYTKTDCGSLMTSRPEDAVTGHDKKHLTAMRGNDEETKYRDEIDHERKWKQLGAEAQQKKELERGRKAHNEVVLRRQGLQAMEWLALVDKMERRARGQELGGGENYSLRAGDVYGGMDESERMTEQAFAHMLGLDDVSVELSVFSINSDDARSVALTDSDHEFVNCDEAAFADSRGRARLKGTTYSGSFDLRDRLESISSVTRCQDEQAEHRPKKPTTIGNMQCDQPEKLEKAEDMRNTGLGLEGVKTPLKVCSEARDSECEDKLSISTRLRDASHEKTYSYESRSSTVAVDDEDKDSISNEGLQDLGDGSPNSAFSAGRLSGALSRASSAENVQSKNHLENEYSKVIAVERDGSLRSVSEIGIKSVELNTGQLGNDCDVGDRALLETPYLQEEPCTTRGDQFVSDTSGHQDKYGNTEEQFENTNEVGKYCSALYRLNASSQSLARDEVNEEKVLERTRNLGRQVFATRRVDASLVEGAKILSATSASTGDAGNHESTKKVSSPALIDERLSLSDSFSALSQKSLLQLDQVAKDRTSSLKQLSVGQQIMAFSDLEGLSNEDERKAEAKLHRPSIGTNSARSSVNFSIRDLYCQQKSRRSSTSSVSVAQYSLLSSNTQNSFDESLDRLFPDHDDSFVNELVSMFPKHTLPRPPRSFKEENQAFEEYDIELVAPNMSRMLIPKQLPCFKSSQQRLIHQAVATDQLRRQPPASTIMQTEEIRSLTSSEKKALSSSSSWRSYSDASSCELDATSFNTSVEQSPVQQHKATGQIRQVTTVAARSQSRQHTGNSQPSTCDWKEERDVLSDISSESDFSSLGFTVQLNIAADPTRKRDTGDDGQVSIDSQHNRHAQQDSSDDDMDKQSIASERSFASSSSMSMDAYFDYLINLTSTARESLPLQLQLPGMMYDKKDMTKPPALMTWSTSSASSVTTASKMNQSDDSETSSRTARRSISNSDSFLTHPPCFEKIDRLGCNCSLPYPAMSYQSEESDASQVSKHSRETRSGKMTRSTFTDKQEITELRLSLLSSRNMSQPPTSMQNLSWSSDDSESSDGQSTDDIQQHHVRAPPLSCINIHQPAASIQRFNQSLDDSHSSSEQNVRNRSFQRRGVQRRPYHDLYDAEEESKQDESSSERSTAMHAQPQVHAVKASGENERDQDCKKLTLAEASQRRHPVSDQRVNHYRDKLELSAWQQQQEQ